MGHLKLHIPGPIEVSDKTFEAFRTPMIGHRSQDFKDLYTDVMPNLQALLYTERLVYLGTSSAWGIMEGALRNLVAKRVLTCMKGAFSDKWLDVAKRCGKEAEALQVEWGSPILPEQIDERLATGKFDAVTLVHNETSTGVMSPLAEIAVTAEMAGRVEEVSEALVAGGRIEEGEPLFRLDDREVRAQLQQAEAAHKALYVQAQQEAKDFRAEVARQHDATGHAIHAFADILHVSSPLVEP